MVPSVKGYRVAGHICPGIGEYLPGGGSGGATIWIGDVCDFSTHWENSGQISPPGDTPTDRAESYIEGRR